MGFSNYLLSIGLSLFAASYLIECLKGMRVIPNLLKYGVYLLLAAMSNPLPVFIIGPLVAYHLLSSVKFKALVGKFFLVSIPSMVICLHFLSRYTPSAKELYNFREMIDFFYGGSYMTVYSNYEFILSRMYLLICLVLVLITLTKLIFRPEKEGFKALIPLYFIAVSFLIPGNLAEQGLMHFRTSFFFFLGCSLFIAMFVNQFRVGLVVVLTTIIIVSFHIVRWPHYRVNNNNIIVGPTNK